MGLFNKKVADIFYKVAAILSILDENVFRIRAYERAAMQIESLPQDLEEYVLEDKLEEIPGIGKDLADKIRQIYETGTFPVYEDLKQRVSDGVLEMLEIPGLGPKKVKILFGKLGIDSVNKLEKFAREGKIRQLPGFGQKTEEKILKGIEIFRAGKNRKPLIVGLSVSESVANYLRKIKGVKKVDVVGSIRRFKDTVGDIDILVVAESSSVMDEFVKFPDIEEVIAKGEKKTSAIISDMQVDVRVFEEESYGSAMMYFTGSKQHNIHLRQVCMEKGLKLNEYGLFRDDNYVAGRTEEEVYDFLGVQWIPPEMREDTGEIELAQEGKLPQLIELSCIRGDLHIHTEYSDGANSIEEIVKYAISLGYEYIAITDHSPSLSVAGGMSLEKLKRQIDEIERLKQKYPDIKILKGMEIDILADGNLDVTDEMLGLLDIVIIAIHSRFSMDRKKMTQRIKRALRHPRVNILAHPTNRLFGQRGPCDIDIEEIMDVALENMVALEINSSPYRLDLNGQFSRMAKEKGLKLAINTDAHSYQQMDYIRLGVGVARRGWLEKEDVLNSLTFDELMKILRKKAS